MLNCFCYFKAVASDTINGEWKLLKKCMLMLRFKAKYRIVYACMPCHLQRFIANNIRFDAVNVLLCNQCLRRKVSTEMRNNMNLMGF